MFRIGMGFDVHPWQPGRPLRLGGLAIPSERGLGGHSDADALLHAVTDALLGAVAAGDIGRLFPDSDPRWKDADSATFVAEAMRRVERLGYAVANCDSVVVAERPRLAPHAAEIQQSVAALLSVAPQQVSIKAKTSEKLGFVGRGEGLAAWAVVLLTRTAGEVDPASAPQTEE